MTSRRMLVPVILLTILESRLAFLSDTSTRKAVENFDELTDSINKFGFDLLVNVMKKNTDQNVVISPVGVAGLLAMALLGSVGSTFEELSAVLGFSEEILKNRMIHEQFGNLLQMMDGSARGRLTSAVVVAARTRVRAAYRDYMQRVYRADAFVSDFTNATHTKMFINEMPFKKPTGEALVELMFNTGRFEYVHDLLHDVHMIGLPYNDSTSVMYIMMPYRSDRISLSQMFDSLNYTRIIDLIDRMSHKNAVIRLPKFEIKSEISLETFLQDLGVKSIFHPKAANFALMTDIKVPRSETENQIVSRYSDGDTSSVTDKMLKEILNNLPNPGIYVTTVIQNVKLTVNEFGTEAAAATAGILAKTAELFYVDSPFFMFIRDSNTKLITFSAAIYDPTG